MHLVGQKKRNRNPREVRVVILAIDCGKNIKQTTRNSLTTAC